ncbi:MAG: hypothetical protein II565_11855 [Fibrobacter sp.]|nr:hypothetical protein [Fibrobacter sp.]
MKKTSLFILVTTALILSGCALLMGTSMRPIVLGKMMIYFRATTSKIYIATEMPEKLEIDTPFDANGQFYYKDAVHDTTLSMATVTLQAADLKMLFFLFSYSKASRNNPEIFPNDISDSLKTLRPFVAFDKYFGESSDNDLTSIIYNSEAHYAYKCVTRKLEDGSPEDVCGASRLTDKGNIILVIMSSVAFDANVKVELLEAINSVEFKN